MVCQILTAKVSDVIYIVHTDTQWFISVNIRKGQCHASKYREKTNVVTKFCQIYPANAEVYQRKIDTIYLEPSRNFQWMRTSLLKKLRYPVAPTHKSLEYSK